MKSKKGILVLAAGLAAFLIAATPLFGEPAIQRYFPQFEDSRFVLVNELTSLDEAAEKGPFPIEFLEEAKLSSLSSWEVTWSSGESYQIMVWEVLDDLGAYQLYTHWPSLSSRPESRRVSAPVGNWYSPDESVFWRGNFLISISGGRSLQEDEFTSLVKAFVENITLPNLLPVTISHLPEEEISGKTPLFYLGSGTLKTNQEFPEPLLRDIGFSDRIEIASAEYGPDQNPLFLIGYPTHELAREYSAQIKADLDGYFSSEPVFLKRSGLLVAVFKGPDDLAIKILDQVNYTPTIQYFQKKEDEPAPSATKTFLGLITKAILGTGTFIVFIIIFGFFAGLLRYQIIERFPKFVKRNDSIRLKLD